MGGCCFLWTAAPVHSSAHGTMAEGRPGVLMGHLHPCRYGGHFQWKSLSPSLSLSHACPRPGCLSLAGCFLLGSQPDLFPTQDPSLPASHQFPRGGAGTGKHQVAVRVESETRSPGVAARRRWAVSTAAAPGAQEAGAGPSVRPWSPCPGLGGCSAASPGSPRVGKPSLPSKAVRAQDSKGPGK